MAMGTSLSTFGACVSSIDLSSPPAIRLCSARVFQSRSVGYFSESRRCRICFSVLFWFFFSTCTLLVQQLHLTWPTTIHFNSRRARALVCVCRYLDSNTSASLTSLLTRTGQLIFYCRFAHIFVAAVLPVFACARAPHFQLSVCPCSHASAANIFRQLFSVFQSNRAREAAFVRFAWLTAFSN